VSRVDAEDLEWPEDGEDDLTCNQKEQLDRIYEEFRRRGDAPECLRTFLYQQLGRILP
jgi:hypothetical protein